MRQSITKEQKRVLDCYLKFQKRHGYTPTMREVSKKLKYKSHTTVRQHLLSLQDRGYIDMVAGRTSGITIL